MDYEACSLALSKTIADLFDPSRQGAVIEVGLGTSDLYCVHFAKLGYRAFGIDPIIPDHIAAECQESGVETEQVCLSSVDNLITLYTGTYKGKDNLNLSSIYRDWWGSGGKTQIVPSMRLSTFLTSRSISEVTYLKVDVEGAEYEVLSDLSSLCENSLPKIVQFEYGGGSYKRDRRGGWSPKYFELTLKCLKKLQELGYELIVMIDRELPLEVVARLQDTSDLSTIFHPNCHVGNMIVCRDMDLGDINIESILKPYRLYPDSLVAELSQLGDSTSTHSFQYVLPYVIAEQFNLKQRRLNILEYGPGCNSKQFLDSMVCKLLVSVEDNEEWYIRYSTVFRDEANTTVQIDYHLVRVESEAGKAYHGGHCWTESEILNYARYPSKYGDHYFDIVFVDSGDRQDTVSVDGKVYQGWPMRNICLEFAHPLLKENGVVILHDVPGPYKRMNRALAQNIATFPYRVSFEEFHTTILSDSLPLGHLASRVQSAYRLTRLSRCFAWALSRAMNRSWYRNKWSHRVMIAFLRRIKARA